MRKSVALKRAEDLIGRLHSVLEEADCLDRATYRQFARLLRDAYGNSMHSEPEEGPLGELWSLRHGAVCGSFYEQLTGDPVETEAA